MGIGCLTLVQFPLIDVFRFTFNCVNQSKKAKFTVKYISKSGLLCLSHAARDPSKKLLSASMSQLHKMFLPSKMYG